MMDRNQFQIGGPLVEKSPTAEPNVSSITTVKHHICITRSRFRPLNRNYRNANIRSHWEECRN
jgi:hypothetical protein